MAGQRMSIATDAPDMQVVHLVYALDPANDFLDARQLHATGRALQQDIEALADDADRGPQDHDADPDGKGRIDPALSGEHDGNASRDDGSGGQRVANLVQQRAAQVNIAMPAHEQ